ncbi:MAG: GAF domain-containing protein [Anaerolineae bacterium]|nr:GAF domain-containing protein [Anaerolineae bacterium]
MQRMTDPNNTPGKAVDSLVIDRAYTEGLKEALRTVADDLATAVGANGSYIYITEENNLLNPLLAGGPVTERERALFLANPIDPETDVLAYRMMARPLTMVINDAPTDPRTAPSILTMLPVHAAVAAPVLHQKQIVGMVLVVRRTGTDPFEPQEVRLVEWFSTAIGLALENAVLYHETQNRLEESQSLHQVTMALLQKLELDEVLQIVCEAARRLTHAAGSSIALVENDLWLRIMYVTGEAPEKTGRAPIDQSLIGLAVRRGETIIENNTPWQENNPELPVSILAVPLRVQETTIGVLELVNKAQGFSADDVRLIELFADQASVAVEHARLNRQVQEMAIMEERHRLSRELHDSVNQLLYGISLYTEAANRQLDQGEIEAARRHLKNVGESAQEALKEMRMLIFELRPSVLGQMGLQAALSQRLKSVEEQVGLDIAFKWRVHASLDEPIEEALYGIAQEALNNIIKHARAQSVTLHLVQSGQSLIMRIEDNGVGFDPDHIVKGGLGLKTMRERAESLQARLEIQSQPGQGTCITVEVTI